MSEFNAARALKGAQARGGGRTTLQRHHSAQGRYRHAVSPSEAEHARLLRQTRDMVISLQRELFEGADVDGDGKVTRAEFEAWHRQRTGEAPDAEEVAVFEGMDADHDGAARTTPCVL